MTVGNLLSDGLRNQGDWVYYSDAFNTTLEHHIPRLINHEVTQLIPLTPGQALQFRNRFFMLLAVLGIPKKYHWVMLRCNDMMSPTEFTEDRLTLIQPPFEEVENIQKIWQANNKLPVG